MMAISVDRRDRQVRLLPEQPRDRLGRVPDLLAAVQPLCHPLSVGHHRGGPHRPRRPLRASFAARRRLRPLLTKITLALYVPGSPFMYMNMVKNRKKAFKTRCAPPPPPKAPKTSSSRRRRQGWPPTSETGKKVIAAAFAGMGTPEGEKASAKCAAVKNWRFGYNRQIVQLARLGCQSPKASLGSAKAGLKYMYENMIFHSKDQTLKGPFGATVDKVEGRFHTGVVSGTKPAKNLTYEVPQAAGTANPPKKGASLSGDAQKQAVAWAQGGIIEPDAADACAGPPTTSSGKTSTASTAT